MIPGISVDDLSLDDLSVNDQSVDDLSVDDVSIDDVSVDEMSVDDISVDGISVDDVSVAHISVDDISVHGISVDDKSVVDKSVDDKSVDDLSVYGIYVHDTSVDYLSVHDTSEVWELSPERAVFPKRKPSPGQLSCSLKCCVHVSCLALSTDPPVYAPLNICFNIVLCRIVLYWYCSALKCCCMRCMSRNLAWQMVFLKTS